MNAVLTVYTPEEAAGVLRVGQSWLGQQAAAGRVPFTMLGGCYRFTDDHLVQIVRIFESMPAPASRVADVQESLPANERERIANTVRSLAASNGGGKADDAGTDDLDVQALHIHEATIAVRARAASRSGRTSRTYLLS